MSEEGKAEKLADKLDSAVMNGDVERVLELLDLGADVNAESDGGPLYTAIWADGGYEVAKVLVEKGADVNCSDCHQYTPLHWAAEYGRAEVAKLLVEHGAELTPENYEGYTALELAARYEHTYEHPHVVEVLLEAGARVTLPAAVMLGDVPKTQQLLEDPNTPAEAKDLDTLLHLAAETGQTATAQLLLDLGANVQSRGDWEATPLHCAAEEGHVAMTELLLRQGACPQVVDKQGDAPLHLAVDNDHIEGTELLLRHGADVNQSQEDDNLGHTPLHVAIMRDIYEDRREPSAMARLLLEWGADINAKNFYGYTPLVLATDYNFVGGMRFLLEQGADPEAREEDGMTALHYAAFHGRDEVRVLLEHGADVHARDKYGRTPLHHITSCISPYLDAAELLLKHGADVNARDNEGRTPLAYARKEGFSDLEKLFVRCGGVA